MRRGYFIIGAVIFMIGAFLFNNSVEAENGDVIINEIGAYEPDGHEWVEIYNKGLIAVDMANWKFLVEGESAHGLNLASGTESYFLNSYEYGVIAENADNFKIDYPSCTAKVFDTAMFALNESGSKKIGLRDSSGFDLEYFNYSPAENFSLERISVTTSAEISNNWQEHLSGNTIGFINYWTTNSYLPPINQSPVAVITSVSSSLVNESVLLNASSSTDDVSIVEYQWSIADSIIGVSPILNYIFSTTGTAVIDLLVRDNEGVSNSTSTSILVFSSTTPAVVIATTSMILKINEFVSDPSSGNEWLELYNVSTPSGDLAGWTLSDNTGTFVSPTGTMNANGFFVIEWSASRLNNAGDIIILKNSSNEIIDQVCFGDFTSGCVGQGVTAPAKGNSIARKIDGIDTNTDSGDFTETTSVTKNYTNNIIAPLVAQHTASGSGGGSTTVAPVVQTMNTGVGDIIINEIFPNPTGSDEENEFIELKNVGPYSVELRDWYLSDSSTTKYVLSGQLASGSFVVYKRPQTKIALNNSSGDVVKLFRPNGVLAEEIRYIGLAEENWSYSRNVSNTWLWTVSSTPERENIFVSKNLEPNILVDYPSEVEVGEDVVFDASNSNDPENDKLDYIWKIGQDKIGGSVIHYIFTRAGERVIELSVNDNHGNLANEKLKLQVIHTDKTTTDSELEVGGVISKKISTGKIISNITLNNIREKEVGDLVRVRGVVVVEPGIFGSQYFYIVQEQSTSGDSAQAGIQVYMNKKDFPNLKVGDLVMVGGELSQAYGELRLKVKNKTDIKIIKSVETPRNGGASLPMSNQVEIVDIGEDIEGSLIFVQGEITELKTSYMYVDDGTDEFKVYFKKGAGIDKKLLSVGQNVKVVGIVSQNASGYQLLPRGNFDIEKIMNSNNETVVLESNDNNTSAPVAETYLTATAGGLTSILIGLLAKARGKFALLFLKKAGKIAFSIWSRGPKV